MAKTYSPVREELRRAWRDLRGDDLSPVRGAAAVAIGLFVGSQPIFGCHTPIVLFVCLWFGLDAAICWVAANISNPFFAPVLLTAEVQVGALVRTGSLIRIDKEVAQLGISGFVKAFGGDLFLGAPFVGLGLAAVGFALTYGGIAVKRRFSPGKKRERYKLPPEAPPWVHAVERVASRYAPADHGTPAQRTRFHYVRHKLLRDPITMLIAGVEGEAPGALGEVLDIGSGAGQLSILLMELGRATRVRGVDWDKAKIEDAARAAAGGPGGGEPAIDAVFERGDAREARCEPADTVLLIDLLHYFKPEEQDAILRRAASAVRPGGRILVREADTEQGWRSSVTLLEERIFTGLRFNRGERVKFRPSSEYRATLSELGFECETIPAWGSTPFSNVLIIGRRRAE